MTDWQRHALWQLGDITNGEYADGLVADGVPEDDVLVTLLRRNPDRRQHGEEATAPRPE